MHMSFLTVIRKRLNFWMRPSRAAMGQPKRHHTRVPISGYMPTPITPLKTAPIAKPYHPCTRNAKREKSGCCLPIAQLTQTMAVVTKARKRTRYTETFSTRQARGDFEERCRNGSPAVFARPPQPQIQEQ